VTPTRSGVTGSTTIFFAKFISKRISES